MEPKKEVQRMCNEILSDSKIISEKLTDLEFSEDGKFMKDLSRECESILASASKAVTISKKKFKTEEELETVKNVKKEMEDLNKCLDEFEEKLLKYNIPRPNECESFEDYLEYLQEFMKIWKQEAEKGRANGQKSLIEWLRLPDQSDHEQTKTTFEAMKAVAIDLGTTISDHLTEFLLLVAAMTEWKDIMRQLDDAATIIGFLSVEENSIVIKGFLSVVKFLERTMRESKKCSMESGEGVYSFDVINQELFRLILQQVLRLEVALCCPDLPMMLIDEVYLSMGSHLREVFKNKLKVVISEINDLKKEVLSTPVRDKVTEVLYSLKETMDVGIKDIWNKLVFQSC